MHLDNYLSILEQRANLQDKFALQKFFQTAPGQYAEGDQFIGVKVSEIRVLLKEFQANFDFDELHTLLISPIHEHRMSGVIVLVYQFKKSLKRDPKPFVDFFLQHLDHINNWDLVDTSCRDILGLYLLDKPRDILYELVLEPHIWKKRIAIVSTWSFIRKGDFKDALALSKILLTEKADIVLKAVGWMLREIIGKGGLDEVDLFIRTNILTIPAKVITIATQDISREKIEFYRDLRKSMAN